jgi:hypothetical protein
MDKEALDGREWETVAPELPRRRRGSVCWRHCGFDKSCEGAAQRARVCLGDRPTFHPHYQSLLTEILSRRSALKVTQVAEDVEVKLGCIYIIAPRQVLTLERGVLRSRPAEAGSASINTVDRLFESLAAEQKEKAIGVILSGAGSDGAQGAMRIKQARGLVLVQEPASAMHDGMPLAAIAIGAADKVLPPEAIARLLPTSKHSSLDWESISERRFASPVAGRDSKPANRSPLEALEVAQEELEALNEELNSVNAELSVVNAELDKANAQLQAKILELETQRNVLLSGSVITLFLDDDLRIRWFTPALSELFSLQPANIGQRITCFTPRFSDPGLVPALRSVLMTEESQESEVQNTEGRWYLRRICPYRVGDGRTTGLGLSQTSLNSSEPKMLCAKANSISKRFCVR